MFYADFYKHLSVIHLKNCGFKVLVISKWIHGDIFFEYVPVAFTGVIVTEIVVLFSNSGMCVCVFKILCTSTLFHSCGLMNLEYVLSTYINLYLLQVTIMELIYCKARSF